MAKKILVVDDDESILDALSLILEEAGFEVQTAIKGDETIEKVAVFKPSLILLDVLMSGKDGREICRKLKEDEYYKKIPIVMLSAHPSAKMSSEKCGANSFLAKPFDSQELLKIINSYI